MSRSLKDDSGVAFRNNCTECQEGFLFAEKRYLKDDRLVLLEQCTKCNHKKIITKALIIEEEWLNMICGELSPGRCEKDLAGFEGESASFRVALVR